MSDQRQNQQRGERQQDTPGQNDHATQHVVEAGRDLDNEVVVNDADRQQPVQQDGAERLPENIQQDPNRDLSTVPGTFNPGNQAGRPVQGGGKVPAGQPGGPPASQNQKP